MDLIRALSEHRIDLHLVFTRFISCGSNTVCPNCKRVYNEIGKIEDWGVAVYSDDVLCLDVAEDGETEVSGTVCFAICGKCLTNPKTIDLERVRIAHQRRGTPKDEIAQGIKKLQLLKEGKVGPEDIT